MRRMPWESAEEMTGAGRWRARRRRLVHRVRFAAAFTLPGLVRFHRGPRKTIVLIAAAMRSGTTLLKALLAEAPDVSHLPEIDTWQFHRVNRYAVYGYIAGLSEQPIVVLKRPGAPWIPLPASFHRLRIVVLCRDMPAVAASVRRMTHDASKLFAEPWSRSECVRYWCETYERILDNAALRRHDVRVIRYEDLVRNPEEITRDLFAFIGSSRTSGAATYRPPREFDWAWGSDDGGETIRSLTVDEARASAAAEDRVWQRFARTRRVAKLRERLGYVSADVSVPA